MLVEDVSDGDVVGRAAHQGPDVDGTTYLVGPTPRSATWSGPSWSKSDGVDLVASPL